MNLKREIVFSSETILQFSSNIYNNPLTLTWYKAVSSLCFTKNPEFTLPLTSEFILRIEFKVSVRVHILKVSSQTRFFRELNQQNPTLVWFLVFSFLSYGKCYHDLWAHSGIIRHREDSSKYFESLLFEILFRIYIELVTTTYKCYFFDST